MGIRNGQQFIDGLRARPRDVWVRGQRVGDVTTYPAFAGAVRQIAALYDMQAGPVLQQALTYVVEDTSERAGAAFLPARSIADLVKRREAYRIWAETHFGLMGRSPDFMNITLLAFHEARDMFAEGGAQFGENIARFEENDSLLIFNEVFVP